MSIRLEPKQGLPISELRDLNLVKQTLTSIVIETVQSILKDCQLRDKSYKDHKEVLLQGIYYPHDYASKLKEKKQMTRLNGLIDQERLLNGYVPHAVMKKAFEKTGEVTGPHFQLKLGVNASDALAQVKTGLSLLDCKTVCELGYYSALEHVWGSEKFNFIFSAETITPFRLGKSQDTFLNPLDLLCTDEITSNESHIRKGDWVFFYNCPEYIFKNPFGIAQGMNAICSDLNGKTTFLGLGLSSTGVTVEGMQGMLLEELNKDPFDLRLLMNEDQEERALQHLFKNWQHHPERIIEMKNREKYRNFRLTREQFKEKQCGSLKSISRFNEELVRAIAVLPPKESRIFINRLMQN